jgi:hypothetical protein
MTYDCTDDIKDHITTVSWYLQIVMGKVQLRQHLHDISKLQEPEKSTYDEFTPSLRGLTYGSEEYKDTLKAMAPAIQHHYENNSHHPEHYPNGINGMSLLDLIEMLADWKAAGMRHADGSMARSMEINRERFGMSDQLYEIFQNTIKELEW